MGVCVWDVGVSVKVSVGRAECGMWGGMCVRGCLCGCEYGRVRVYVG